MRKASCHSLFLALVGLAIASVSCRHDAPASATLTLGFGKSSSSAKSFAPEDIARLKARPKTSCSRPSWERARSPCPGPSPAASKGA